MGSSDEVVLIVDENNQEIGRMRREAMRQGRHIHRASYVLVFNAKGELFVQQRTMSKDIYPGYYDIAAGGVVLADETYEESAQRELYEELGVVAEILRPHFDHYFADSDNRVWGRVFSCVHQGPFVLQKDEVVSGKFMNVKEIVEPSGCEPITPDGLEILYRYIDFVRG